MKASKKVQQELFTRKKNRETGLEELLTTVECLTYKKSSQQLASCVIAMRDSPFCKMFSPQERISPSFCFKQEKALKNFSKKLYTIHEIKKQTQKVALGT